MTLQAARFTPTDLPSLAAACHDLATRWLVRFIDAQDRQDPAGADAAWRRYQNSWQAELAAVTSDGLDGPLPVELQRLLDDGVTAAELAMEIDDRLPALNRLPA